MKIETKDVNGRPNGFVVPIWNALECKYRPDQVYLTAVLPGCVKGPHLHQRRTGYFCCVKGHVTLVLRVGGKYKEIRLGEDHDYLAVGISTGTPAAIYNLGPEIALVLNLPSPAWSKDDPDEWPVENWNYIPHGFPA